MAACKVNTITILVGLPRSGKSTWTEINKSDRVVISADRLRYRVYGQRFFGDGEPMLWAIRGILLEELLSQGQNIIVDETNTTKARRGPIIKLAKKHGYYVEVIEIATSKDECIQRAMNEKDGAIIPVIERMAAQYEPPSEAEGIGIVMKI